MILIHILIKALIKDLLLFYNGVIENYEELRQKHFPNISFVSQTDTEVCSINRTFL